MAESAAQAGYVVTTLDAFGDLDQHPGVRARSLPRDMGVAFTAGSAARAATALSADAVAYVSPFENHPRAVSQLAEGRMLWGNNPMCLRRVRNPRVFAEVLERHGVVVPGDARDAVPPAGERNNTRWIVKPRASGGGHGVRWWHHGDALPRASHVQRFIQGVPASVAFVAAGGKARVLGLTRQLVGDDAFGAAGFRYCGSILPPAGDPQLDRDLELLDAATTLINVVAREFGLVGVNGIDFIARDGVPVPIEVNPRYSASMELVEQAYGVSVFGAHAAACATGDLPTFDLAHARTAGRAYGKAVVFARHDVVCGDTRPWLDDPTVRDVPHPGEHIPAGRPVCTVFASGGGGAACYRSLVRRAEHVYTMLESWAGIAV
jgi:hypothetical protein